jgi:hypothetical protein
MLNKKRMRRTFATATLTATFILGSTGAAQAVPNVAIEQQIQKNAAQQPNDTTSPRVTPTENKTITAGSGNGYWQVGSDGGVFAYGDAQFAGSAVGITDAPIVGIAKTGSGAGYWLVAENGAVFAFGDAKFWGSAHDLDLNAPIVGIERTASGNGYYLVAADGGIFAYGDAEFFGSAASLNLNWMDDNPVLGMTVTDDGLGYWMTSFDGVCLRLGQVLRHGTRLLDLGNHRHRRNADRQGLLASRDRRWHLRFR